MTPMSKLDLRYRDLRRDYFALRRACEAKVARWELAAGGRHDPRPFWYERHRERPGKVLPEGSDRATHRYGFDDQGVLWCGREPAEAKGHVVESFHVRKGDAVEISRYENDGREALPLSFARFERKGESSLAYECRGRTWAEREHYHFTDGRIVRIDVERGDVDGGKAREPDPHHRIECAYDDGGRLARLAVRWLPRLGQPIERVEVVLEPSAAAPPALTAKALAENAGAMLFSRVVEVVQALALKEAAYALVLVASPPGLPCLAIGADRDRQKLLQASTAPGKKAKAPSKADKIALWSPVSMRYVDRPELVLASPALARVWERLRDEAGEKAESVERKVLVAVAARLGARGFPGALPTTEDFVCYATEPAPSDPRASVKAQVPAERFASLKSKGLV